MKALLQACLIISCSLYATLSKSQCDGIILNEIHYDNSGSDVGEFIEVAIPTGNGLTLSEYTVHLYNGSGGATYNSENVDNFTIGMSDANYDYHYWEIVGIQNGDPDGFGLSKNGLHCELLSYEGTFTAAAGTPANGVLSVDIMVSESNNSAIGESLQLVSGVWDGPIPETKGDTNTPPLPSITIDDVTIEEGDTGLSTLIFTTVLSATDPNDVTFEINTLDGTATTSDNDYIAISAEIGTISAGNLSTTIEVSVVGDSIIESNEEFNIILSNVSTNASISDSIANSTIINDDFANCPNTGDIIITEIMNNPAAVSDNDGEYIELYNKTDIAIDIEGWLVSDNGSNNHTIANGSPLMIPATSYLIIGINDDSITNGGLTVDYEYSGITLGNSEDEIIVTCALNGVSVEIDRVEYDNGITFPDPDGASMNLNPNNLDAVENDNGLNWCESTSSFGDGDLGTPGQGNDVCGTGLPTISINDFSSDEGDSGTSSFTFTVMLSSTSSNDVSFEINTADGTATAIDNDYQPLTMSTDTILAGSLSTSIDVIVYGDTNQEPDESFNVILSNISSNAFILDSIGVGTILSDESNCPNMWNLSGMISGVEDYETSGLILSDQLIKSTAIVDYDATTTIELLPGFEIELGAIFEAFIDGCNNGGGGVN